MTGRTILVALAAVLWASHRALARPAQEREGAEPPAAVAADEPAVRRAPRPRGLLTIRRAGAAVGSALALAALSSVTTFAAFRATTVNGSNAASAGTVVLTDNDTGAMLTSLTAAAPGNSDTSCIAVTYSGALDATVRLYASATGALPSYLTLTVTRGSGAAGFDNCTGFTADATDYIGAGAGVVYSGSLASFPASYATGLVDPKPGTPERWTTGEAHTYRFVVTLDDNNAAQGLSGGATFTWEARDIAYSPGVLTTSGLVGYWRLGETSGTTAVDAKNSNNGTYNGGVTLNQTGALANDADKAASFDGVDDYVSVPDSAALDATTALTIEAWLYKNSLASERSFIAKENAGSDSTGTWLVRVTTSGTLYLERNNQDGATSTSAITAGAWHHVAITFDNAASPKIRFYINAQPAGTSSGIAGAFTANAETLLIGRRGLTTSSWWDGWLDEVAVYNTALTQAQIREHYSGR